MSGGSEFESLKLTLHNSLNDLQKLTIDKFTIDKIRKLQRDLAELME